MDYQKIRAQAIEFMFNRAWKEKTAKRKAFEQSLFDHTLIELDAFITLLPILRTTFSPTLTEQEEQVLLASVVAHDVGKELDEWQEYVMGRRDFLSDVNRKLAEEIVPPLAALLGFTGIEEMLTSVLLHMRYERTTAKVMERVLFGGHTNPRWKTLADLVDAVDNLCSAKGLFAGLQCLDERSCFSGHIRSAYHLVQLRGVSTTLLHRAAIDAFMEKGWSPLLHYSNGTIYVASATANVSEPSLIEIAARLAESIKNALPQNMAELIVGSPLETMIPKVDLFDYRDLRACLQVAARKVNRASFAKKPEAKRRKTIGDYLALKSDKSSVTVARLARETERISAAQPEMCIFKFFKAALAEELLGKEVTPEAKKAYVDFAEGGGKRKAAQVTPQSVARAEYDKIFGEGAYAALQSTSTLMQHRDMALAVDRFWSLSGKKFGLQVARVENLLDHTKREAILIDTLVAIAEKVYAAVPEANRPTRATPEQIAKCFMADLIHPVPQLNLTTLVEQQMQAYAATKANARKNKGIHLCPICNMTFEGGTIAKADFLANPESHTNRAVSHGNPGYIVICEACKFERFLQQLLLGSKVAEVLVLFPRMNIGHSSGEMLRKKAIQIWEAALTRMTEANPDPDQHLSLGMTFNLARKLAEVEVFRLSPAELVEVMTYRSRDDTAKRNRRDLEKRLQELYEVDELTAEVLNENWGTEYGSVEEALQALIDNRITDDDARKMRAAAFRLTPQLHIACQTPHLILVPLTNPISIGEESDANAGIRELYVTLMLGLALDCSVAVVKTGEVITFEGGEGVAGVPPVPALRDLIGADWVAIEDAQRRISAKVWLDAIGAAALLANATAFPERTNLYAILKSPTVGHVLRRLELKNERNQAHIGHFQLLEKLKEVLR
jgi:hypothetical protein